MGSGNNCKSIKSLRTPFPVLYIRIQCIRLIKNAALCSIGQCWFCQWREWERGGVVAVVNLQAGRERERRRGPGALCFR